MMRAFPLLTTRREWSIRARFLVAILALIQFIAPTWHVCEMGGSSCCPPKTGAAKQHCARPSTPAADAAAKPHCAKCPQAAATSFQLENTPAPHGENCLAKLLLGMPLQEAAPVATLEFAAQQTPSTPAAPRVVSVEDLPQPPSRAPPVFSL